MSEAPIVIVMSGFLLAFVVALGVMAFAAIRIFGR
jgi:hypothetical protein